MLTQITFIKNVSKSLDWKGEGEAFTVPRKDI